MKKVTALLGLTRKVPKEESDTMYRARISAKVGRNIETLFLGEGATLDELGSRLGVTRRTNVTKKD